MELQFRLGQPCDFPRLENLVIDAFEPITYFKRLDEKYGPLGGKDWRQRWQLRMQKVFESQQILVGELEGEIVAYGSGTYDPDTRQCLVDLLAVDGRYQGRGFGRAMLHAMIRHFQRQGAEFVYLECLTTNDVGNSLYRAEGFEDVACLIRWFKKIE